MSGQVLDLSRFRASQSASDGAGSASGTRDQAASGARAPGCGTSGRAPVGGRGPALGGATGSPHAGGSATGSPHAGGSATGSPHAGGSTTGSPHAGGSATGGPCGSATFGDGGSTALAGAGLLGGGAALLGASCCVLPVVLTMAGLGGSWLAVLGIFVAWSWYLLAGAGAVIGAAWIVALRRRARPRVHVLLGVATVFFAAAVLTVLYEVEINRFVLAMWRGA